MALLSAPGHAVAPRSAAKSTTRHPTKAPLRVWAFKGPAEPLQPKRAKAASAPSNEALAAPQRSPRRVFIDLNGSPVRLRRMSSMVEQMQREMDELLMGALTPQAFSSPYDRLFEAIAPSSPDTDAPATPASTATLSKPAAEPPRRLALEVGEDEVAYYLHAEVPGFSKDEVKVTLSSEHVLTITAARKEEVTEGGKGDTPRARFSRRQSSFRRSVALPEHVDTERISATTKDGVLSVTVPKLAAKEPQVKEIPVL